MLSPNRKTRVVARAKPQKMLAVLLLWKLSVLPGCVEAPSSPVPRGQHSSSEFKIRNVNSAELHALVESADRPVLVEFSVLSGCPRCNDMRSPIRQKAADMQHHANIVRVDFNLNRGLAQQVGATVCPSYVVYSKGKLVSVRRWPTSADFVAADVEAATGRTNGGQGSDPTPLSPRQ